MSETVCTDGVVGLREWEPEDAQWYADSVQDPDIQRFTTDPPTLTAAEVRTAIIALRSAEPPSDGLPDVGLLICDATTGDRLGNIAFAGRGAELSYWVAAPARGRGVATRALRLLADYALDVLHADELRLWTHSDNVASGAVADRPVGFVAVVQQDEGAAAIDMLAVDPSTQRMGSARTGGRPLVAWSQRPGLLSAPAEMDGSGHGRATVEP